MKWKPDAMDWEILGEMVFGIAFLIPLIVVLGLGIGCLAVATDRAACHRVEEITSRAVRFDWLAGCFVRVGNDWVPLRRWQRLDMGLQP